MSCALARLSEVEEPAARARFLRRFADCPASLLDGPYARYAPSPAYTETVLDLGLRRPSELFLAIDGDRVVARSMAATSFSAPGVATMGLFEMAITPGGASAGRALIEAGVDWAIATGHHALYAPVDVVTWFSYRFLIPPADDDAAVPPYAWEPAQPDEYPSLFLAHGFEEAERYITTGTIYEASAGDSLEAVRVTNRAYAAAAAAGYRFEQLAGAEQLDALLEELHPLCMDAFSGAVLFEPLPVPLFRRLYMSAAASRDCSPTHVVRDAGGQLTGFVFAFVDGDAVVIKTIAVAAEARGRHLSTALSHLALRTGAERGLRSFVSALVRRGNTSEFLAQAYVVPGVRAWKHEYVLLRKNLEPR
jgi:ribosomal protein S18 acetylase RimI-like enzyme